MWNDDDEINECGEAVVLYSPAQGPPRRKQTDMPESHVGGSPHGHEPPPCTHCEENQYLLSQIRISNIVKSSGAKVDRTVCVYACPKTECFESLKFLNGFAEPSPGVMCCHTVETPIVAATPKPAVPVAPVKSAWYSDDKGEKDDDDDFGFGGDDDHMANLENALASMEMKLENGAIKKEKQVQEAPSKPPAEKSVSGGASSAFPCYVLKHQNEPLAPNKPMEDDDVGLSASDDKIRNMLARYMAEEEDQDILAALQGTATGGGIGEEDERLSEEQRLLLGFQDRLHRASRQVIRYARGGKPLWSIPSTSKEKGQLWQAPICKCGKACTFEMQLLPSLLHVLEVDKFAGNKAGKKDNSAVGFSEMLSTGMNWGSLAVFTCREEGCSNTEGGLVVQESVDENPQNSEIAREMDFTPAMAVVEDMDDDEEFEPYVN